MHFYFINEYKETAVVKKYHQRKQMYSAGQKFEYN